MGRDFCRRCNFPEKKKPVRENKEKLNNYLTIIKNPIVADEEKEKA